MLEITPIEFEQENYRKKVRNGECIVWYKNEYPIEWVREKNSLYELHYDGGWDNSLIARVRKYQHCLVVEDTIDRTEFRERIKKITLEIIEKCHDDDLLYLRISSQQELIFRQTKQKPGN